MNLQKGIGTTLFLAALLFAASRPAEASGEVRFLGFCKNLEYDPKTLSDMEKAVTISCVAFIAGVTETHKGLVLEGKLSPLFCRPPRVTDGEIGQMYAEYERNHPPDPRRPEAEVLLDALKAAYPCGDAGGERLQ